MSVVFNKLRPEYYIKLNKKIQETKNPPSFYLRGF